MKDLWNLIKEHAFYDDKEINKRKNKNKNNWLGFVISCLKSIFLFLIYVIVGANFIWYATRCINVKDTKTPDYTLEELLPTYKDTGVNDEQAIIQGEPSDENNFYFPDRFNLKVGTGKRDCGEYDCIKDNSLANKSVTTVRKNLDMIFLNKHGFPYSTIIQDKERNKFNYLIDSNYFVNCSPHAYWSLLSIGYQARPDKQHPCYLLSLETLKNWIATTTGGIFCLYRYLFRQLLLYHKTSFFSNETFQLLVSPFYLWAGLWFIGLTAPFVTLGIAIWRSPLWTLYTCLLFTFFVFVITGGLSLSFALSLLLVPIILDYKTILNIIYCNREIIIFLMGFIIVATSLLYLNTIISGSMILGYFIVTLIRIYLIFKKKN